MSVTEQDYAADTETAAPLTALDVLKGRRQEIAESRARELPLIVPDYHGALRIVYRYPDGGADTVLAGVQRAQRRQNERGFVLSANLDLIVNCCDRIEGRDPETHEWTSLDPSDDRPLTFSPRLANLLGLELPEKGQARFLARHVFSPGAYATGIFDGDIAAINQAGDLALWLAKTEEDTSQEFLGE